MRNGVLAEQEHAGEVHVEYVPPVRLRERIDRRQRGYGRRVRHHDVESPERVDRRFDPGAHRSGIADVAVRRTRAPTRIIEFGGDGRGCVFIDVQALHRGAFRRECPRDCRPDACRIHYL